MKYTSEKFLGGSDVNHVDVSKVLMEIRVKHVNNVIIGQLNVNSIANKLDDIRTIIPGNVDVMIFTETKLDDSHPTSELHIDGFCKPFRSDRNANGGGVLIYVREDIPCKQLNRHSFSEGIEGIFVELNFRKCKWLLFGTYRLRGVRMHHDFRKSLIVYQGFPRR